MDPTCAVFAGALRNRRELLLPPVLTVSACRLVLYFDEKGKTPGSQWNRTLPFPR